MGRICAAYTGEEALSMTSRRNNTITALPSASTCIVNLHFHGFLSLDLDPYYLDHMIISNYYYKHRTTSCSPSLVCHTIVLDWWSF